MAEALTLDDMPTFVLRAWATLAADCGGKIPGDWTVDRLQVELAAVAVRLNAEREADGG